MPQTLWTFSVTTAPGVERVSLVTENEDGVSTWIDMSPQGQGRWTATRPLGLDGGQVHYLTQEGSTFINCGTHGLRATRLSRETNLAASA